MRSRFALGCFGALVFLACLPTEPCACPPSTSLFLVYGSTLDASGAPVAAASVKAAASQDENCVFESSEDLSAYPDRSSDTGRFRTQLRSYYGDRSRCIRLVAVRDYAGEADSSSVLELIVRFRIDREPSDSIGVVLRFQ